MVFSLKGLNVICGLSLLEVVSSVGDGHLVDVFSDSLRQMNKKSHLLKAD